MTREIDLQTVQTSAHKQGLGGTLLSFVGFGEVNVPWSSLPVAILALLIPFICDAVGRVGRVVSNL